MKTKLNLFQARLFCAVALGVVSSFSLSAAAGNSAATAPAKTSIPWSQIGQGGFKNSSGTASSPNYCSGGEGSGDEAVPAPFAATAGADYQGDGLAVSPAAEGVRLRCVFQRLEGEATHEGLWLTSTVTNGVNNRFRVVAVAVGRQSSIVGDEVTSLTSNAAIHPEPAKERMEKRQSTAALTASDFASAPVLPLPRQQFGDEAVPAPSLKRPVIEQPDGRFVFVRVHRC